MSERSFSEERCLQGEQAQMLFDAITNDFLEPAVVVDAQYTMIIEPGGISNEPGLGGLVVSAMRRRLNTNDQQTAHTVTYVATEFSPKQRYLVNRHLVPGTDGQPVVHYSFSGHTLTQGSDGAPHEKRLTPDSLAQAANEIMDLLRTGARMQPQRWREMKERGERHVTWGEETHPTTDIMAEVVRRYLQSDKGRAALLTVILDPNMPIGAMDITLERHDNGSVSWIKSCTTFVGNPFTHQNDTPLVVETATEYERDGTPITSNVIYFVRSTDRSKSRNAPAFLDAEQRMRVYHAMSAQLLGANNLRAAAGPKT